MPQLSGEFILAEDIVPVRYIKKIATETITSSTTQQNDDDIAGIALAANKVYLVQFYGAFLAATGGDIATTWVVGGGAAQLTARTCIGPATTTTNVTDTTMRAARHDFTTAVPYGGDGTRSTAIQETFLVETTTSGNAGTLTLQWAQGTSNGTGTQLTTSTFVVITEVEAG